MKKTEADITQLKNHTHQKNQMNQDSDNMNKGNTLSMPKGWEIKKLGEIADVEYGFTDKAAEEGYFRYVRITDINGNGELILTEKKYLKRSKEAEAFLLQNNDLLMARTGATFAKVLLYEDLEPSIFASYLIRIKFKEKIENRLYWYFSKTKSYWDQANSLASGAAQPHFNGAAVKQVFFSFPKSLPEQQGIVSILDEVFAAIAKAKVNAEQNLKNAKELFESYLQGVFEKLFNSRDTKKVSDVAKVIGGYSFKSTDFKKEGKYQVLRMGNVRPGIIRENENPVFIDELEDKALSKALLLRNDVIITQTGTKNKRDYGFTVIIEKENYLLNQRIASIRFSDKYLPKFFLYFSWTSIFKDQYFANETGTVGQGNVGIGAITDAMIPFIPVKEQELIIDRINEIRFETQKLEAIYQQKLLNLEELKKSILQKAFNGEL